MSSNNRSSNTENERERPRGYLVNGELIRHRREALGLTVKRLAERVKANPRTITRAENPGGRLAETTIRELARVLSVSPGDLILSP